MIPSTWQDPQLEMCLCIMLPPLWFSVWTYCLSCKLIILSSSVFRVISCMYLWENESKKLLYCEWGTIVFVFFKCFGSVRLLKFKACVICQISYRLGWCHSTFFFLNVGWLVFEWSFMKNQTHSKHRGWWVQSAGKHSAFPDR